MDSIWKNTFYDAQPALSWVYKVSFIEYINGEETRLKSEYINILSQAIVDIQVGKRESEYASVYYGGLEFKKLTRAINTNNFSIKFNENKYFKVTEILEKLYNHDNMNQKYTQSNGGEKDMNPYNSPLTGRYKIVIKMFDPNTISTDVVTHGNEQNPTCMYVFYGTKLVSLDDITLSYESVESITRSATFVYDYMMFYSYNDILNGLADAPDPETAAEMEQRLIKESEMKNAGYAAQQKASNGHRGHEYSPMGSRG